MSGKRLWKDQGHVLIIEHLVKRWGSCFHSGYTLLSHSLYVLPKWDLSSPENSNSKLQYRQMVICLKQGHSQLTAEIKTKRNSRSLRERYFIPLVFHIDSNISWKKENNEQATFVTYDFEKKY
ncbi:hypothetical protein KSF78_0007193 [Schistosoma japonicum]|nr:hypothetical protein KSF78_0007193 [Schistosoma japonicum]